MRFVILHYHIFKNAGSTIEDILDHSFGERFGTLETAADGGLISNEELIRYFDSRPEIRAFSSHQIRYPMPTAPGYLFFDICFLRDPLDRLRSFYDYFRQRPNPADPMSELANRCSVGDFAAGMIRDHSLFIRNNQVNLLACAGDSDEPGEADLIRAMQRIREASFPGVVDCFEQSSAVGAKALRRAFPELEWSRPPVNVSKGMQGTLATRIDELRDACGKEVYAELLRITELDRRLVDFARGEVQRRGDVRTTTPLPIRILPPLTAARPGERRRYSNLITSWRELLGSPRKILFDADYYRDGLLDFLTKGVYEGRKPHPLWDPAFYLRKHPDVAAAGVNPFCHYLKKGRKELRQPHPLFDPVFYLERNPDVRAAGLDPLLHYLQYGAGEDRKPNPFFDPKYYRANCVEKLNPAQNPLIHFAENGAEAASPHPLFDCEAYLAANPEVAERNLNPLAHYLEFRDNQRGAVLPALRIEIQDVEIALADLNGETHRLAEPQQRPFLRTISMGQLRVQAAPGMQLDAG